MIKKAVSVFFVAFLFTIITSLAAVAAPAPVDDGGGGSTPPPANCKRSFLGIPHWYQYVELDSTCSIVPPTEEGRLVILIMLGIFDIILFVAGLAAFIFIIWGGFKFLTSTGEPQKIAGARTTIINALVGLAIAIIGSNIVGFIAQRLG